MVKVERPKPDLLEWLLEPADINVRYLALRDLTGATTSEVEVARGKAHAAGPIADVLVQMQPDGYWEKPGPGYNPKYTGTVWSIILLSQLGAREEIDKRISAAVAYLLEHTLTEHGQFTMNGLSSGTIDCLQGNLCSALLDLGCRDPRLDKALEWMARSVTGNGIAPMTEKSALLRYYSGKCGPLFACGGNNKLPCAWGAAKVMLAFSKLPAARRDSLTNRAIQMGVDFLFSSDPARAAYPCGWNPKPSGNWWKFGFPIFYVTDLLQIVEALAGLGYGTDPRLAKALNIVREKQDSRSRWLLEYAYNGKTWLDSGPLKQPNKWVTWRALKALGLAGNPI
jgi:hypothetical protein